MVYSLGSLIASPTVTTMPGRYKDRRSGASWVMGKWSDQRLTMLAVAAGRGDSPWTMIQLDR